MLLGKRTRPSIRRTTSMKGLSLDPINLVESSESSDLNNNNQLLRDRQKELGIPDGFLVRRNTVGGGGDEENVSGGFDKNFLSNVVPLPRNHRRNSGDFSVEPTANFLRSCDLCKRRLAPGRDIFIYRGDTAFCSLECREQKINQDERKERHSWVKKIEATPMTAGSETLSSEETIIAA